MSALFRWRCNISIHLFPRSVTAGVRPFPLAMQHFYSFVSQVCHCWCQPFAAGDARFLFVCLPGLSLVVSALFRRQRSISIHLSPRSVTLFRWPCSISIHLSPRLVTGGVRPLSLFLFICFPGLSLVVSALFRWRCIISIHLSPRSVTASVRPFPPAMQHFYSSPRSVTAGVRPCPLAIQHFYSCVSQACHWWCPPFSSSHVAFLFFCLPGLSLVCPCLLAMKHFYSFVSQVRHCWLSFRTVTGGVRPCPLAMKHFYSFVSQVHYCWCPPFSVAHEHFYSFVSQVCHCWCPPFSVGHAALLFISLPGLSLLVSALFRWRCNISIHFSRSVTAGVRPFPLVMQHYAAFLFICFPGLSLVVPPFSAGHVAFLFTCLPCDFFLFVFQVWCLHCCFLPCLLEQVHL